MPAQKTPQKGPGKFADLVHEALHVGGTEKVVSSGDRLTIETIADFAQQIRDGLAGADTVVIEFGRDVELDITALQVFCSACKTATAMNKQVIHRGPLPKTLLALATAAGSERFEHCKNNNTSCFRQFGGSHSWAS